MSDDQVKLQETAPEAPVLVPAEEVPPAEAAQAPEADEDLSLPPSVTLFLIETMWDVVQQTLHDFAVLLTTPIPNANPLLAEFQSHLRQAFAAEGFILPDEPPAEEAESTPAS